MISLFFTFLSIIIIARVVLSYTQHRRSGLYDFAYRISEPILSPIRKRLPRSPVDWSPLVALIILNILGTFLPLFITAAAGGEWGAAWFIIYYSVFSTFSSLLTLFIIIFAVKYFNDLTGRNSYSLTVVLEASTEPVLRRIRNFLPFGYKRYTFWVALSVIVVMKILIDSKILKS